MLLLRMSNSVSSQSFKRSGDNHSQHYIGWVDKKTLDLGKLSPLEVRPRPGLYSDISYNTQSLRIYATHPSHGC